MHAYFFSLQREVVSYQSRYLFLLTTKHVIRQTFILKGDDEDDTEDEKNIGSRTNSDGPSAKRQKPAS